ncbi:MAG: DUF6057 family protein, partial [Bacteroidales bacterium]|nr:DUF6057 family protein [Bacteroidales bacterium]
MRKLLSHKVSIALYLLLSVFVVCWYSLLNPYLTLVYYEQSQMFQYTWTYFLQHISHPGGWINYCGLFLTQFFYYPLIGIFIYVSIFLLLGWIFQYIIERVFLLQPFRFLTFIPALCILPVSVDVQFNIAYILAVIIALVGFLLLMQIVKQRYYYLTIPALVVVLYLFIGGNVIMSILLFISYSFLFKQQPYVRNALIIIVSWMIVLVVAWNFYLAPGKEIFFSYTPFNYPVTHHRMFYLFLWFSVILIPLIGFLLRNLKMNPRWA